MQVRVCRPDIRYCASCIYGCYNGAFEAHRNSMSLVAISGRLGTALDRESFGLRRQQVGALPDGNRVIE